VYSNGEAGPAEGRGSDSARFRAGGPEGAMSSGKGCATGPPSLPPLGGETTTRVGRRSCDFVAAGAAAAGFCGTACHDQSAPTEC
jgi:hypothetical protein